MTTKNTGGPAFPVAFTTTPLTGMSLRDWFAAQVFAHNTEINSWSTDEALEHLAAHCYRMADFMLAERDK